MSRLLQPKPFLAALLAGVVVVLGLAAAAWYALAPGTGGDRFAECRATAVAGGAGGRLGGPFELTAHTGERMTAEALFSEPALLYFGYTFCPDYCPFDTARNIAAVDILEAGGHSLRPVFISFDPARDTPERLADWSRAHHPEMISLTGTEEEVAAAARAWRVYYAKAGDDPEYYTMDHTTFTYLVGPGGEFLEVYRSEATPEEIADSAACYLERL